MAYNNSNIDSEEYDRIIQNPDNLIVSPDLLDRLAPAVLTEAIESEDRRINVLSTLLYDNGTRSLRGDFHRLSYSDDVIDLMITVPVLDGFFLLDGPNLTGFEIYSENDDSCYLFFKVIKGPKEVSFDITKTDESSMLISYTIPKSRILKNSNNPAEMENE
jgi:hypothetical protein